MKPIEKAHINNSIDLLRVAINMRLEELNSRIEMLEGKTTCGCTFIHGTTQILPCSEHSPKKEKTPQQIKIEGMFNAYSYKPEKTYTKAEILKAFDEVAKWAKGTECCSFISSVLRYALENL